MNKIITVLTSKRFKSFYWRTGMMVLAGFTALFADNISLMAFSPTITVVGGLILGEISKALNTTSKTTPKKKVSK